MPERLLACQFPGLNDRHVGMGSDLDTSHPHVRRIYEEASEAADQNMLSLCQQGPEEKLLESKFTQVAVLATSYAYYSIITEQINLNPQIIVGHSLGEYTALVAAGSLKFTDAAKLVFKRGALLDEESARNPSSMVIVVGADLETVEQICQQSSTEEYPCEIANINSQKQIVVAGRNQAIENVKKIVELLRKNGVKCFDPDIHVASHCSLEKDVAQELSVDINATHIEDPSVPVISNVTADYIKTGEEIKRLLVAQLTNRVLWLDSFIKMTECGINTFYEFGSSDILTKLTRRNAKDIGREDDISASSTKELLAA